jgi:hypothetical protein
LAWGCGLDSTGSGQGPVACCCESMACSGTALPLYIYIYRHTSREHISMGYDDTFYEECVSIILYGILCCFMSFYVVRFKFVHSHPEDESIHSKPVEVLK